MLAFAFEGDKQQHPHTHPVSSLQCIPSFNGVEQASLQPRLLPGELSSQGTPPIA